MDAPQTRVQEEKPTEARSLASELAHAYLQMTAFHRDRMHLEPGAADRAARGLDQTPDQAMEDLARIWERPPDQVEWADLQRLILYDPHEMVALWEVLKTGARDELASGHLTAQSLEWNGRPQDRARFLAIRDSFRGSTPPQNGIESALVDTVAEAFSDYLHWTEQVHTQAGSEAATARDSLERHGSWSPVRLSAAEAIELSSKMAERAHKRLLQTVKLLHDLQRTNATVYVGNAAQVNLASQQINVATAAANPSTK